MLHEKIQTWHIPDRWPEMDEIDGLSLTLHERLAIAEAIISSGANTLEEIYDCSPPPNYVVANVGFLVSEMPADLMEEQSCVFITIPIADPDFLILLNRPTDKSIDRIHSEEMLYNYFKINETWEVIINILKNKFQISVGHQIYAVVLDIHSTNVMCGHCESDSYLLQGKFFQNNFPDFLEIILKQAGYRLPAKKYNAPDILTPSSQCLYFAMRITASKIYSSSPRPQDELGYQYPEFNEFNPDPDEKEIKSEEMCRYPSEQDGTFDVRKLYNSVVLHKIVDEKAEARFRKKTTYAALDCPSGFFAMPKYTAFENYYVNRKSCSKKRNAEDKEEIRRIKLKT